MQVQNTNDSSIASKLSSAEKLYFQDDYLLYFVEKKQNRAPIINRGYYIRFKAMEAVFQTWLSIAAGMTEKSQIISLGAGFDSSYLRLKGSNKLTTVCRYVEVDFPEVMRRKLQLLKQSSIKSLNMDFSSKPLVKDPAVVAYIEEYVMLGIDLKDIKELQRCFDLIGVNYALPTLFLSECAITYMDITSSNNLISWIRELFPNSVFAAYEQVYPYDAFGIVMQNHFISLQCPLKSVVYSDEEKQRLRYLELGWSDCCVVGMYSFFMTFSSDEKLRIQSLELFDEFEVWHEKCHHYVLIWASQGIVSFPELFRVKSIDPVNKISKQPVSLRWHLFNAEDVLFRYGHESSLMSSSYILVYGGFGQIEKKHQRLGDLALYHLKTNRCFHLNVCDPQSLLGKRMFHRMISLSNGFAAIIGGRSSPNKSFSDLILLKDCNKLENLSQDLLTANYEEKELQSSRNISVAVEMKINLPVAVWRHSASVVEIDGLEHIVIFGGRTCDKTATNGCYILNTKNWIWNQIPLQQHTPSSRHSHSSVCYNKCKVVITGGLAEDENILNSVYVLDCQSSVWSYLHVAGLLPRYSHTSHFYNNYIFLIGGVTNKEGWNLGIGIINLETFRAIELQAPMQDPEYPLLLINHSSCIYKDQIVILGGGGNCFSFGTHFNKKIAYIDIKSYL